MFCDKCKKPIGGKRNLRYISASHRNYWSVDMTLFRIKHIDGHTHGIFDICEDCMKPILDYLKLEKVLQ